MLEQALMEHKRIIYKSFKDQDDNKLIETLLSLRVNALQLDPSLRLGLVNELVLNDILQIKKDP